jgi:uncharacterized membrane protein YkvA (DUF1232 family)
MEINILEDLKIVHKLIYKLLIFPESDWKTKIYASTAMAYLINPNDIIPETEKGDEGYLDDLYLCLLVLKDLFYSRKDLINLVNENELEIETNIKNKLIYCEELLGDKTESIKKISGYDSLKKFDIENQLVDSNISKQIKLNATILGSISFFYDELVNVKKIYEEIRNPYHINKKNRHIYQKKVELSYSDHPFMIDLNNSNFFFDIKRICLQFNGSQDLNLKIDTTDNTANFFLNYEEGLKRFDDNVEYYHIIKFAPSLFKTLCDIYNDPKCNWFIKHEINSALTYFSLIDDVIDDTLESGIGFVDDIFIAAFVLYDIAERDYSLLNNNLNSPLNISIIKDLFGKSSQVIEPKLGQIINLLGLRGLMSFFDLQMDNISDLKQLNRMKGSELKIILNNILDIYFNPKLNFDRKSTIFTYFNEIKQNLTENKILKLEKFIELAKNSCYHKNVKNEIDLKEEEELRLLLLKHEILGEL